MSAGQLRWWKWHLSKDGGPPASKSAMVRVEVRAQRPTAAAPIEIMRGGWTVRVGHTIDGETLGQVLDAIGARPC